MYKFLFAWFFVLLCSASVFAADAAENQMSESAPAGGAPFAQNKFVPDISFILDCAGVGRNLSDATMKQLVVPGFKNTSDAPLSEEGPAASRGLNFNYGEMSIASTIDPYFDLSAVLTFSKEGVDIEEGYFGTRTLPFGFYLRAGKFKSSFGRVNSQHEHAWDFADQPRIYDVFFGEEGLNETGVRADWLVPVPFYLLVGGEVLQGENEGSFGSAGFSDANGSVSVKSSVYPNVYTGYVKTSFDLGDFVILAGLSNAYGRTRINHSLDEAGSEGNALTAHTDIAGADITVKYLMDSYRYVSLQSEYLYRYMDGKGYDKDSSDTVTTYDMEKKQSGLYSQLIFRFAEEWRIGLRYQLLQRNDTYRDGVKTSLPSNLPVYSAMIDCNLSEFSRIRLQYNYDRTAYEQRSGGYSVKPNHEVILQCNMAIGSHGAHSF